MSTAVNIEKLSPVLVQVQIEVPADIVNTEVNNAFSSLKRNARVKGFRKGKAPRQVLQHLYGAAVRADVAKQLMDRELQQVIKDKALQPLTEPAVEPAELNPKAAFSFKARFEVRPEIEELNWVGLQAIRPPIEVTDEQLDERLQKLRQDNATKRPVEGRAAKKGDVVQLKISFSHDGQDHNEEIEAEVGGGEVLGAIDEELEGMSSGESKNVTHEFAANHPSEQLQGAKVTFDVQVEEVKEVVLPEIDDELAKDLEHADLAALKADLRENIAAGLKQSADEDVAKQLVAQLCEKNPLTVPPSLVEQQARESERQLVAMARMSGQAIPNPQQLAEQVRADSDMKVRAGLLMAEIAKEKEVKVTEEDIEKGYQELAEQSGKNVARIKAEYRQPEQRQMLVGMILEDKVLDLLEQNAKISDATEHASDEHGSEEGQESESK